MLGDSPHALHKQRALTCLRGRPGRLLLPQLLGQHAVVALDLPPVHPPPARRLRHVAHGVSSASACGAQRAPKGTEEIITTVYM